MRCSKSRIVELKDADGTWRTKDDNIEKIITYYFANLFSTSHPTGMEEVFDTI